jgi:hypothetical protein
MVMNTKNWKELGMAWLRKQNPTKGCKAIVRRRRP